MRNLLLALFLVPVIFTSCRLITGKRVKGNGNIRTEERPVSSFTKVEVRGAMKVYIKQGDLEPVRIEADENLLPYIELIQNGDELTVKTKNGFNLNSSGDMKIYVTAPIYKRIQVSGACDIIGQNKIDDSEKLDLHVSGAGEIRMDVDAPSIAASISGSGNVNLKGETKKFDLELSGAGKAKCYELLSENTKVDISGAGDAEVYASVKLEADVRGAGTVNYKGNAKSVNQHVSGAGSVNRKD
ncbi:MAG: head GIN domain-containing protein [Chitinophagaceae bacterium]